jgi:hypothetical protein
MVHLDLRDSEIRQQEGLSDGTVTSPSQHRHIHQEHRDRAATEQLILRALYEASAPMSRLQIARALGRSKTPWLYSIIESLVADQLLIKTQRLGANGVVVYWYEVRQ